MLKKGVWKMKCPYCKSEIDEASKTCQYCGRAIEENNELEVNDFSKLKETISEGKGAPQYNDGSSALGVLSIIFGALGGCLGFIFGIIGLGVYHDPDKKKLCRIGIGLFFGWVIVVIIVRILIPMLMMH